MKNRTYYHQYGKDFQKAGFLPSVLAVVVPFLPKIGPLAKLRFKTPTPEAEKLFVQSFDSTLVHYQQSMNVLQNGPVQLANTTLDTGYKTVYGEYSIADDKYGEFILMLNKSNFENISAEIKNNLISFYSEANPTKTQRDSQKWSEITEALKNLEQFKPAANR